MIFHDFWVGGGVPLESQNLHNIIYLQSLKNINIFCKIIFALVLVETCKLLKEFAGAFRKDMESGHFPFTEEWTSVFMTYRRYKEECREECLRQERAEQAMLDLERTVQVFIILFIV